MIKRSGATSIPEALRLVPEVEVVRLGADRWLISARGLVGNSNKLQVLIDGRSAYDLLFAGVLWEEKDVMLEDVDRIEVIRGPGGTLWGANAVNGVINIITKKASETRGTLVSAGGGSQERVLSAVRSGVQLADNTDLRLYAKYNDRAGGFQTKAQGKDDASHFGQAGFRMDSDLSPENTLTLQGDGYAGRIASDDVRTMDEEEFGGVNMLGHFTSKFSKQSELSVLTYYDHTELDNPTLGEIRDTMDFEAQQSFEPFQGHRAVAGIDYRLTADHVKNTATLALFPQERTDNLYAAFLEDRMPLRDYLFLTLGSKIEWNDYTNFEYQPTARLSWNVNSDTTLWSAVSRAVRIPSRLESDLAFPQVNPILFGNPHQKAEELLSYELGLRKRLGDEWLFDIATYYNVYDRMLTPELPTIGSRAQGDTWGGGLAATWTPLRNWQVRGGYSHVTLDFTLDDASTSPKSFLDTYNRTDPQNGTFLHSSLTLANDWDFDVIFRYSDSIPALQAPSYLVGDVRVAYRILKDLELSVVGQNLFDGHHWEDKKGTSAVPAGVYGKAVWRF